MTKLSRLLGVACFGALVLPLLFVQAQDQLVQKHDDGKQALEKFHQSFGEAIHIQESKPVRVQDAEFVVVAQTNWRPGRKGSGAMVAPIAMQFRITNLSKTEVIFESFHTLYIRNQS